MNSRYVRTQYGAAARGDLRYAVRRPGAGCGLRVCGILPNSSSATISATSLPVSSRSSRSRSTKAYPSRRARALPTEVLPEARMPMRYSGQSQVFFIRILSKKMMRLHASVRLISGHSSPGPVGARPFQHQVIPQSAPLGNPARAGKTSEVRKEGRTLPRRLSCSTAC